ncbi:MAG TPA: TFIIB-type zinc ribbon-containing protein [Nitrososphaeraceae archaeon]
MSLLEEALTIIIIQDPATINVCSTCKRGDMIVTDAESGEIVCSNCGMVISDKTQDMSRSERRAFSPEEANDRIRSGSPASLARYDKGLATVIGNTNTDASGRHIDAAMRTRMHRLRIWDSRARIHNSGRNLVHAFDELDILKDKLGLSDALVEKVAYIYRKALDRRLVRGRTTSGLMAAAIYAGCREMGTPWTLKDIAAASNIKRKDIARNYRMLLFEFELKIPNADPLKCISKVANKAKLTENTKRHAISIMKEVSKKEISAGKDPMGLAASILYISCLRTGEDRTQIQIANASGVTDVTVRNRLKELKNTLHLH